MRIYLIGMPGCGKSTIGKIIAEKLAFKFIDLDEEIEKDVMMFIEEIFECYGEETFRNQESRLLKSIGEDNVVISTGGGIVKREENKEAMKGIIIYLDTPLDNLKERLENDTVRPLLKENSLDYLYEQRHQLYEDFADFRIFNHDMNKCVEDIMEAIKK